MLFIYAILCLSIMLMKVTVLSIYSGPDASYYVPLQRWVRKGAAQQLESYRDSALFYGIYAWDVDCDTYKWKSYYGPGEKDVKCEQQGKGIYLMQNLAECAMNLITNSGPPIKYKEYNTPLYARTRCAAPYNPVSSHLTVSAGPGWYLIRFPVTEIFMYVQQFRLIYRQLGDERWIKPKWPGMGTYEKVLPRVKPSFPCPPWPDFSMFCILVTDFIRIYDHSHQDYEGEIQTQGYVPPDGSDFEIKNYRFIFRVHYCDVTVENDCPDLRNFQVDDTWNPPTMSPEEYEKAKEKAHSEEKEEEEHVPTTLLIVFIILLLLIPPILFFIFFFIAKKRAAAKARHNWYFISAPNWPVHYTLRLPPDLRRNPSDTSGSEVGEVKPGEDNTYAKMSVVSQKPAAST